VRAFAPPAIVLTPTGGPPGTFVIVQGSGFQSGAWVSIYFNQSLVSTYPSPCKAGSQAHGSIGVFTCSFAAPVGVEGNNNVTAINATDVAMAQFNETFIGALPDGADVGQTTPVQGWGFGASLRIDDLRLGGIPLNCTGATIGNCSGGVITTDPAGDFNVTVVAPPVPASNTYKLTATDSAGTTHHGTMIVYLDPTVGNITASAPAADVGQRVTFRAVAALGSGGYAFRWSGLPGCPSGGDPLACVPTLAGNVTITVTVTDSNNFSVTSNAFPFQVVPDPTVATPLVDPASVDVNQSVTFTTSAELGSGSYTSYNWSGLPEGCNNTTASFTCVPQFAGAMVITVTVTDSLGMTSARSGRALLTVDADPMATLVANRTSADVGQLVRFTGSATLGSGSYEYAWTGLPQGCTGGATATCTVSSAGLYEVQLQVTDANHYEVASPTVGLRAYDDPTVTLVAAPSAIDAGQHFTMNATATNGSGGFSFAWTGLPHGCSATKATVRCSPSSAANYTVEVTVRDSNGGSARSAPVELLVAPLPSIPSGISLLPTSPAPGAVVTFTSAAKGGVGTLTYAWVFDDGSTGSGASVLHTYSIAGVYTVALWVNDTVGGSAHTTSRLTVANPAPPTIFGGASNQSSWLLVLAVAVVLVVVALLWVRRRRHRGVPPDAPAADAPPEGDTGPDPPDG
jgi:PKD repeat protein